MLGMSSSTRAILSCLLITIGLAGSESDRQKAQVMSKPPWSMHPPLDGLLLALIMAPNRSNGLYLALQLVQNGPDGLLSSHISFKFPVRPKRLEKKRR